MGPEKKVLYIVQSLVAAYIVTGLLLCLLAFIVYQSNTGTKMANLGITLTYIFASILAGMIIGKRLENGSSYGDFLLEYYISQY